MRGIANYYLISLWQAEVGWSILAANMASPYRNLLKEIVHTN